MDYTGPMNTHATAQRPLRARTLLAISALLLGIGVLLLVLPAGQHLDPTLAMLWATLTLEAWLLGLMALIAAPAVFIGNTYRRYQLARETRRA